MDGEVDNRFRVVAFLSSVLGSVHALFRVALKSFLGESGIGGGLGAAVGAGIGCGTALCGWGSGC